MTRPTNVLFAALLGASSFVAATSASADGASYDVKPGDNLSAIAAKLGVPLSELLTANALKVTSVIHPGDDLLVPPGGRVPPAATLPAPGAATPAAVTSSYVVGNGEYLFSIAAKHGVTVGALLAANGLKLTSVLLAGQTLAIPPRTLPLPAAAAAPAPTRAAASPAPVAASTVDTVVAFLQQQIGKPYKFNTAGPETFDCSGLVKAAFGQVGVKLPHYSLLQTRFGTAVNWAAEGVRAGDLVFTFSSASPGEIGHVGVAIDAKRWIHAAGTGDAVKISALPRSIQAVRRLL
jgi:cell wall-associated NlpC family hydrolase